MRSHRSKIGARLLVSLFLGLAWLASTTRLAGSSPAELPSKLSDQEFWTLTSELSEPDGTFQSDNLLSNELVFARTVPALVAATKPDGVYMGVGPEQNFTYIAAMKPRMAFITDIRRATFTFNSCTRPCSNCRPIGRSLCHGFSARSGRPA